MFQVQSYTVQFGSGFVISAVSCFVYTLSSDTPHISSGVPTQCSSTSAVIGVTVTAVLVLLVVAVVQFAVIWHQWK